MFAAILHSAGDKKSNRAICMIFEYLFRSIKYFFLLVCPLPFPHTTHIVTLWPNAVPPRVFFPPTHSSIIFNGIIRFAGAKFNCSKFFSLNSPLACMAMQADTLQLCSHVTNCIATQSLCDVLQKRFDKIGRLLAAEKETSVHCSSCKSPPHLLYICLTVRDCFAAN